MIALLRFHHVSFAHHQGYYDTQDAGFRDEDGNIAVTGRLDDVINVAGHRLSTGQMEEVRWAGGREGGRGQGGRGGRRERGGWNPRRGVIVGLVTRTRLLGAVALTIGPFFNDVNLIDCPFSTTNSGTILHGTDSTVSATAPWYGRLT